ncbi:bifunctional DNA primase/polymerase [Streptomyces sp. NPDC051665]|uniref:bifunctional DNA primase/polymerase n=1 Tax=Streptomyces sp. NPDC051665 TaxID=3154647 RepID=UPI0034403F3B
MDTVCTRQPVSVTPHGEVAARWMQYGTPVIRCSRRKRALESGWGAETPAAEILEKFGRPEQAPARWSGQHARDLVGLLTGRSTRPGGRGLLVVDLDMPYPDAQPLEGRWANCCSGVDVLEMHARAAGESYPETYTVMTPSIGKVGRGEQLYFLQPEDGPLIGCATGAGAAAHAPYELTAPHLGPMVDIRGAGGYVIAVGCHVGDRAYERVSPPGLGPQPIPGWLLKLLRSGEKIRQAAPARPVVRQMPTGTRAERYAVAALNGELEGVSGAGEGERNRRLFAAARRLGELSPTAPAVLAESTVQDELLAAARAAGLGEQEALHTIRSGWSTGSRSPLDGAA